MPNRDPKQDEGLTDIPASEEEFLLEEILAEYGGSLEQTLLREAEPAGGGKAPDPEPASAPEAAPAAPEGRTPEPERPARRERRRNAPPEPVISAAPSAVVRPELNLMASTAQRGMR